MILTALLIHTPASSISTALLIHTLTSLKEEDAPHTLGVALMLSTTAQKSLIGWEAHGPRILTATIRTKIRRINMDVIQCYAPTNETDEAGKDDFYDRLLRITQSRPQRNILIVMGDLNAKIGEDLQGHHTENQLDHVCIKKKFRRSLQDVRVKRGADVGSDHHLLVARLKLKLKKNYVGEIGNRKRYNLRLLKENTHREEFKLTLSNKFQVLQELLEEESIDHKWHGLREALTSTCQEVLGPKKTDHKEWISAETFTKIEERKKKKDAVNKSRTRTTKQIAQKEYAVANKNVKKSFRKDARNFVDMLANEAEEAAHYGNMRQLYSTIKMLSGKVKTCTERPIKDKNGKTIPDVEGKKNRWREHFEELLNRPEPRNPPDIQPAENDLPINCEAPTKEEIRGAINHLRNGKATGPDGIPAEALKADVETSVEMLHPLFIKIWEEDQVPTEWKEGYLIKLPKKRRSKLLFQL
ncbi:hypothetical protein RRG08_062181 [Elysia crispata]|uniref:Endonuclease/exonuclease/phosphatase domain-containing protein n=1 Tax=Elysia crispata TaxID=231223 RepID=A0AAE0YYK5_9GAST|nr:hypothetical protein RRG08_062181 [Elysia crispata]